MKLDMNRAWNEAVARLLVNRQVVTIIAGVFFFLPYALLMIAMPGGGAGVGNPAATEAAGAEMAAFYERFWWTLVLLMAIQGVGTLGIIALLSDHRKPTVGDALKIGGKKVLAYLGAYFLLGMVFALVFLVVAGLTAATTVAAGGIVVAMVPLLVYAMVKFSLVPPILVKEDINGPVVALQRSWRITGGNSLRLFAFYFLLVVATVVVAAILTMISGFVFSLMGEQAAIFGGALVAALANAIWATILLAVLSAVHDQLATGRARSDQAKPGD